MRYSTRQLVHQQQFLWSFPRLFRRMCGATPLTTLAEHSGIDVGILQKATTMGRLMTIAEARQLLRQVFGINRTECERLILGLELYDLGLRDNDLRQLTLDLIAHTAPPKVRRQLRTLYRGYANR